MADPTPRTAATAREWCPDCDHGMDVHGKTAPGFCDGITDDVATRYRCFCTRTTLAAAEAPGRVAALEAALRSTYEKDPPEVMKDDYAYDRLLAFVHDVAARALAAPAPTVSVSESPTHSWPCPDPDHTYPATPATPALTARCGYVYPDASLCEEPDHAPLVSHDFQPTPALTAARLVWSKPGCVAFVDGVICGKAEGDFMHHDLDPDVPHGPLCHPYKPGTLAALATSPAPTPSEPVER